MSNENMDVFTNLVNNNKASKDAIIIAEQTIQQALYYLNIAKNNPNDKTIQQAHDITQEAIRLVSAAYQRATIANSIDDQKRAEQLFTEAKKINEEIEKLNINNKFNEVSQIVERRSNLEVGKPSKDPIPKSLKKEPVLCGLAKDIAYFISNHKKQTIATALLAITLTLPGMTLRKTANDIKDTTTDHLISTGLATEEKNGIITKLTFTQSPKEIAQALKLKSADGMRMYLNLFITNFNIEEIDAILKELGYPKGIQEYLETLGYKNENGKSAYEYYMMDCDDKLKNMILEIALNPEVKEKYLEQYPELARFYNEDSNTKGRSH